MLEWLPAVLLSAIRIPAGRSLESMLPVYVIYAVMFGFLIWLANSLRME